jgi:nondiscriminating aspartyl-tRNA synthetase
MRILARDIADIAKTDPGAGVELSGWVHRIRDMGGITFVVLRDRSGLVQLVCNEKPVDASGTAITMESVISVQGKAALNEKAPGGAEVQAERLECLSRAAPDLPFQVNGDISKMGIETILDNRILSVRNPKIRAIFNVEAVVIVA